MDEDKVVDEQAGVQLKIRLRATQVAPSVAEEEEEEAGRQKTQYHRKSEGQRQEIILNQRKEKCLFVKLPTFHSGDTE